MEQRRRGLTTRGVLLGLLTTVLTVMFLFPLFWTFLSSFKTLRDVMATPPLFVFHPTINHYVNLFTETQFPRYMVNSLIVTISTTLLAVTVGTLAAYSIARLPIRGKRAITVGILVIRMVPMIALAVPIYMLADKLNMLDTRLVLIITYTTFNLPFVIWMMLGYIKQLPVELEEAARVDGCTQVGALFRVVLPLAAPGAAASAIFCAVFAWNEFLYALVLTSTRARTLPVTAAGFITLTGVRWEMVLAASTVIVLPLLIFVLSVQRYFVKGLTMGAVKG